jgi:acyl dehydratase|tara:strand:- start:463 stop:918 length:456 start_codon:yes stop_codon:yes gene_type:complete
MSIRYAEDFEVGEKFDLGRYHVTREEIVDFAQKYDPFPFHVDEEFASKTVFGGIISSGWLTSLVWLRLMHKNFLEYETVLGSPGHEEVKWPTPVRPDDQLEGTLEVLEQRVSSSRPDLGFVRYRATLTNQNDETVFDTTSTMIIKPRPTET